MCTLIVVHRVAAVPLIVLANRDEFLARPSLAPALREGSPAVFCGLDAKEGGTWFGINAHGLVVGLTNLTLRPPDPRLRSRGLLCMDMLRCRDVEQVRGAMGELEPGSYNPFNLVAVDGREAVRARYDRDAMIESLSPGVHATTNWPVDSVADRKRRLVESRVRALVERMSSPGPGLEELRAEAGRHDAGGDPTESVCCHVPGYGTRASTIVLLDPDRRRVHVEHADGPPCETPYVDRSAGVAAMVGFTEF